MAECTIDYSDSEDISSLTEKDDANLRGVVGKVSPMLSSKTGTEYFSATLSDGQKDVCVFGYRKRQRNLLKDFEDTGDTVSLKSCKIQHSKYTDKLEVKLKANTDVVTSPKKIKLNEAHFKPKDITLSEIDDWDPSQRVSFTAKVLRVKEQSVVSDGLKMQNIVIADKSKAMKLVLWEKDIGSLLIGKTYHFNNFVIKLFQSEKYIQWPKSGANVKEMRSIGKVVEDDVNIFDRVDDCEITGVISLDCYLASSSCKGRTVTKTEILNMCTKCGMTQKRDRCSQQMKSKLLVTTPGGDYMTVTAFGHLLTQIIKSDTVTEENLLSAPSFGFTYNHNIINSVFCN